MATNKPITADTNADNGDCGDFHAIIILGTTTTLTSRNESCNELIEDVDKEYEYFLYEKSPSVFDLVDNVVVNRSIANCDASDLAYDACVTFADESIQANSGKSSLGFPPRMARVDAHNVRQYGNKNNHDYAYRHDPDYASAEA